MRTKVILLAIAFAALDVPALAQNTGGIRGTVTEPKTGRPVAHATVYVHSPAVDVSVQTDAHGVFRFFGLPPGRTLVDVVAKGYVETRFVACVRADNFQEYPVHLMRGYGTSVNRELGRHPEPGITSDLYSIGYC